MYTAFLNCRKNKSTCTSALQFSYSELCRNILDICDDINNRTLEHSRSSCFVITSPSPREIFAAQFRDRVIQHFFIEEVNPIIEEMLVPQTTSCRTDKGTDYALRLLKDYVTSATENGTKDAFYVKIDLSGYFMSIQRSRVTRLMNEIIETKYQGNYKEELLYISPIIFMNNPSIDCIKKSNIEMWAKVPERKRMKPYGDLGMAIGNITAQVASNLNLNDVDHFCIEDLDMPEYVRYVDDIIIVNKDKKKLVNSLPLIETRLSESGQTINRNKTIIDTTYHGIKFLGKVTYPYGYQKASKESAARTIKAARGIIIDEQLIARLNSQIGKLKNYSCYNLIHDYNNALPGQVWEFVVFDETKMKFSKGENYGNLRNKN